MILVLAMTLKHIYSSSNFVLTNESKNIHTLIYFGIIFDYIVSKERKPSNPKNIFAIVEMPPPKNPKDIQVYNGMA
jgi:hypothetical protein